MKAIPTIYNGTRFRSRLEARWAAFFDLAGVHWVYEPIDLNGWAPDFLLNVNAPVYAEVKPISATACPCHGDPWVPIDRDEWSKAKAHQRHHWVLLLGTQPNPSGFGSLLDPPDDAECEWFEVHERLDCADKRTLWRGAGNVVQWRGTPG